MSATPARTMKGRKLPGQYGNQKSTQKNLIVVEVDPEQELLLVRGSVPGPVNGLVRIELVGEEPRQYTPSESFAVEEDPGDGVTADTGEEIEAEADAGVEEAIAAEEASEEMEAAGESIEEPEPEVETDVEPAAEAEVTAADEGEAEPADEETVATAGADESEATEEKNE